MTFGTLEEGKESAPGQLEVQTLRKVYNVKRINKSTKVYGLIGNPVSKSKGYIVHNKIFQKNKTNAIYVNFLVDNYTKFYKAYKDIISGASITMPFKNDVRKHTLNKPKLMAMNTIKGDTGYNTDMIGAMDALRSKTKLKNKTAFVIGAGGVAEAIISGLTENNVKVTVTDLRIDHGKKIARKYKAKFEKEMPDLSDYNIIINCTPVGMAPNIDNSPVEKDQLKNKVVMDAIYNPPMTKLLKMAKSGKSKVVSGLDMFALQAIGQQKIWTRKRLDLAYVKRLLK